MSVTIALSKPVLWHDAMVREIVVNEPTGALLMKHGNAVTWNQTADGNTFPIEDAEIIRHYVEGCVAHEGGKALIGMLALEDAFAIRDAVISFFTAARFAAWSRAST